MLLVQLLHMTMSEHTKLMSQSCFYHIPALHHIRGVLDLPTATAIASALIFSRLDYTNSVLYGSLSKTLLLYREPKTLQKELLHKNHHTSLQLIHAVNSTGFQFNGASSSNSCLSYLQGHAHWYMYSTLPIISSYFILSFSCSQVIFLL